MDNHFGSSLRALRKKKKLTLEDLGEILKISKSSLSDYENEKSYPPLDACALMSKFFGISIATNGSSLKCQKNYAYCALFWKSGWIRHQKNIFKQLILRCL